MQLFTNAHYVWTELSILDSNVYPFAYCTVISPPFQPTKNDKSMAWPVQMDSICE